MFLQSMQNTFFPTSSTITEIKLIKLFKSNGLPFGNKHPLNSGYILLHIETTDVYKDLENSYKYDRFEGLVTLTCLAYTEFNMPKIYSINNIWAYFERLISYNCFRNLNISKDS
ncbi:hypothetical protein PHYBLDRAFT_66295 [Phycomyces blakesleeanus NRRL 1555(-)]|uniref:Uncharacterized protein n=1 Tax=Phycomyces blakesleeanus (strain ATCC 8743b / DSM 1359 / FGSC 10004 / NBRC 33097 / NRRL 1555) TaxID=763407 RepID=A0A162NGX1_PHYB8|nr:hypothetical protein PHYBLDRAFT_66295 [Phycomyces blakesleeanus NRRL 1555(-)]OAD69484.1 hypothetical protein PHYBLDRAFT_66295 [Phycomyces blakesleeanus NRRL 1555(-)]|eukprot:XP_018287524.1 hypothetical protein PHYBLDRAFT_66295 [Phycomyces blakesleeanus NRRL 1555(-)]